MLSQIKYVIRDFHDQNKSNKVKSCFKPARYSPLDAKVLVVSLARTESFIAACRPRNREESEKFRRAKQGH